ncbi:hypothetical protein Cfla_3367 [Cellulomonas flavigena DSM 20109]|uniref:Uncharacterized protein n=1 Tax=Cellulomonas flavigena (strain ATCC 482 / DSM 20109 / BCRC 11376 / JCM 18109 / NBRC 3775 / NCIMB 8073 / NRS 134) TaxID=446466 RepID=D5UCL1_CELFN|nr:hypothetical protein [Cellulomonas flavigena]ADG76246.1 hypothetical protein Cfla_3367 [Cellulomonas flavigena DSM 20109]
MTDLPPPVPAPRRTSLTGPVTVTAVGVLLLVGALVAAVVTAGGFVGALRTDVLTRDGEPGPAVLAWTAAPGAVQVQLDGGERYAVYLVVRADDAPEGERPRLEQDVLLQAPSGEVVAADGAPGVNMRTAAGGRVAATVGAFTALEDGTYTLAAPPAGFDDAWVAVASDKPFVPFFSAIWGTVLGVFVVIGLGIGGGGALVGGVVWWVLRARARRGVGPGGGPAGPPPGARQAPGAA